MRQRLIIFTRNPQPGATKTRLIPHLGADGAADLQRAMTEHTLRQARHAHVPIEIRYTGGSEEDLRGWLGDDLNYAGQGDGDLGQRMERAFDEAFADGTERVVIIGCDCPAHDARNIQAAFDALASYDLVIGPAQDGGYYLIGLRTPAPRLFHGIDWGGPAVRQQTLQAARDLSIRQLDLLSDVDRPEDIPPKISVIIPTLNEAAHLPATLERVREGFRVEVIVVDGGSTDGTRTVFPGALIEPGGRAAQQNRGARKASGKLLLFLHADTQLPVGWDRMVRETLADESVALGAFRFKVREPFPGRTFIEDTANRRSEKGRLPFGDQGLFMRRTWFDRAGGFPEIPIMEDYALVRRMQSLGQIVTRPEAAVTSGRRWLQHGVMKVTVINKLMILGYHLGIPPARLAAFYRGHQ